VNSCIEGKIYISEEDVWVGGDPVKARDSLVTDEMEEAFMFLTGSVSLPMDCFTPY
jgi:hypothetical protein